MNTLSGVFRWLTDGAHWRGSDGVPVRIVQHLELSGLSLLIVIVVALPVALWLGHIRRGGFLAVNITNVGRAIPTFALLTVLTLTKLGISDTTVIVSLVLFGLPPALTNAYVGVREVDAEVVEAARGMGMTGFQQLRRVELPLAMPLVVNGVRLAAVQIVATMTIASLVAGPGLGRIITEGFATQNTPELEAGALLVVILALTIEVTFAGLQRWLDPVRRAYRVTNAPPPGAPELLSATDGGGQ